MSMPLSPVAVACLLAVLATLANVYVGLYSGVTPNLSLVGVVVAALLGKYWMTRGGEPQHALNVVQTGTSAGTSIASGLVFTVPALLVASNALAEPPWLWLGIAGAGGAALGLLTVLLMVRIVASGAMKSAPEAETLRAFIEQAAIEVEDSQATTGTQRSIRRWAIGIGLMSGLLTGIAVAMTSEAFSLGWPVFAGGGLGVHPVWVVLGVIVRLGSAKGIVAGGILKMGFVALVIEAMSGSWGEIPAVQDLMMGSEDDRDGMQNGIERIGAARTLVSGAASLVLGMAAAEMVGRLLLRIWRERRQRETATESSEANGLGVPGALIVTMAVVAAIGLGALVALNAGAKGADVLLPLGYAAIAFGAAVLAERAVSLVGLTMNPSSSMGLLVGAGLALWVGGELNVGIVGGACFVVCATSASADLVQDLRIGRVLRTPVSRQVEVKWWGLLLGAPAGLLFAAWILNSPPDHLLESGIPQARALDAVFQLASAQGRPSLAVGVVAMGAVTAALLSRTAPILIGIGMLLSTELSVALLLGAFVGDFIERGLGRKSGMNGGRAVGEKVLEGRRHTVQASVVLAPVLATIVGGFAIGLASAALVTVGGGEHVSRTIVNYGVEFVALVFMGVSFWMAIVGHSWEKADG